MVTEAPVQTPLEATASKELLPLSPFFPVHIFRTEVPGTDGTANLQYKMISVTHGGLEIVSFAGGDTQGNYNALMGYLKHEHNQDLDHTDNRQDTRKRTETSPRSHSKKPVEIGTPIHGDFFEGLEITRMDGDEVSLVADQAALIEQGARFDQITQSKIVLRTDSHDPQSANTNGDISYNTHDFLNAIANTRVARITDPQNRSTQVPFILVPRYEGPEKKSKLSALVFGYHHPNMPRGGDLEVGTTASPVDLAWHSWLQMITSLSRDINTRFVGYTDERTHEIVNPAELSWFEKQLAKLSRKLQKQKIQQQETSAQTAGKPGLPRTAVQSGLIAKAGEICTGFKQFCEAHFSGSAPTEIIQAAAKDISPPIRGSVYEAPKPQENIKKSCISYEPYASHDSGVIPRTMIVSDSVMPYQIMRNREGAYVLRTRSGYYKNSIDAEAQVREEIAHTAQKIFVDASKRAYIIGTDGSLYRQTEGDYSRNSYFSRYDLGDRTLIDIVHTPNAQIQSKPAPYLTLMRSGTTLDLVACVRQDSDQGLSFRDSRHLDIEVDQSAHAIHAVNDTCIAIVGDTTTQFYDTSGAAVTVPDEVKSRPVTGIKHLKDNRFVFQYSDLTHIMSLDGNNRFTIDQTVAHAPSSGPTYSYLHKSGVVMMITANQNIVSPEDIKVILIEPGTGDTQPKLHRLPPETHTSLGNGKQKNQLVGMHGSSIYFANGLIIDLDILANTYIK